MIKKINLYPFVGSELERVRRFKGLTQEKLSDLSGVTTKTIRNIEKGYVDCNISTLFLLFETLEINPNDLFKDVEGSDTIIIRKLIETINDDLDNFEYANLEKNLERLQSIDIKSNCRCNQHFIEFYNLLYLSIFEHRVNGNYKYALDLQIDAMKINRTKFDLGYYQDYQYHDYEIRGLSNLSLTLNNLGDNKRYNDILKFSYSKFFNHSDFSFQLSYNYAVSLARRNDYQNAYYVVENLKERLNTSTQMDHFILIYYLSTILSLKLSLDSYQQDLARTKWLLQLLQDSNINKMINNKLNLLNL